MKYIKILVAALILFAGYFYWQMYTVAPGAHAPIFFEINAGENFDDITAHLKEKNLIRSSGLFKHYAFFHGLDEKIKTGRFRFDAGLSPAKILAFLASEDNRQISVTIPEGFTIADIDKKLTTLGLIKQGEFAAWAAAGDFSRYTFVPHGSFPEGYLFPDTYFVFSKNFKPRDLGLLMVKNFEKKVAQGLAQDFHASAHSAADIIKVASILEKEVRTKKDYAIVAGILWKRLDAGWPLQADSTLLYGKENRQLFSSDLREDSAYNTYTRKGLPPTPINNPGLDTIMASLHPADSAYWFYLTSRDGETIYARTNEEHNANKQKYL